jgi:hypothetical protein
MGCPTVTGDKERDTIVSRAITSTVAYVADNLEIKSFPNYFFSAYEYKVINVLKRHGIVDSSVALESADYAHIHTSIVATSLDMESWGGKNIWGGDPGGDALPVQWFESPVTYPKWRVYWANVERGLHVNGCGRSQLTDKSLQEAANSIGGCWLPLPNGKVGAVFMSQLLKEVDGNVRLAFQHYNGSGPAAIRYGEDAYALYTEWQGKLNAVK